MHSVSANQIADIFTSCDKSYERLEDEKNVISESDIEESEVEMVQNGNQTVITVILRNDLFRSKWFNKILKTFTIRCFLLEILDH